MVSSQPFHGWSPGSNPGGGIFHTFFKGVLMEKRDGKYQLLVSFENDTVICEGVDLDALFIQARDKGHENPVVAWIGTRKRNR